MIPVLELDIECCCLKSMICKVCAV